MGLSANPTRTTAGLNLEAKSSFRVFNTEVEVALADWQYSGLLPRVEAYFRRFEARFSRFSATSGLSLFNRREQETAPVSPEMLALLDECLRLHRRTAGIFNPLIIGSLEGAGYDASFEQLSERQVFKAFPRVMVPSLECLDLDHHLRVATLPLGLRLDFGGIGKGYAVDNATALLPDGANFLIDAGGDIYAAGFAPQGGPWQIDVANPIAPEEVVCTVALSNAAIATSWTTKRRWRVNGGWAHHMIDPRTGQPAESGVIGATVIAPRTVEADVFAKCALILGPKDGPAFLDSQGVQGLLVLSDGSIQLTAGWPAN